MGNVRVKQTVNINSGGGGGGSEALVALAVVVVAAMGLGALVLALEALLAWLLAVVALVVVCATLLLIVFRKQLARHYGGPGLVHVGEASLLRDPDRDMPKAPAPREIIHRHYVYPVGPGATSWTGVVEPEIIEAEILP